MAYPLFYVFLYHHILEEKIAPMKKLTALILALCLCAAVSGCSAGQKPALSFSPAAPPGALYPLGATLANLWNETLTDVSVTSEASGGGLDNLNFLYDGEADLGFAVTSIMYESYNGTGSFEGRANEKLRVVAGLYYNPNQLVAAKDSGIESMADIAGKRFALGAPGSTTLVESELHLEAAGVAYPDGFTPSYVGFTEAIDLIRNRQLDAAWIMAGVPNAAVTEITSTAGGRLVSIDEDVIDSLMEQYPWYARYTIPAGTYAGQDADVTTTAIKLCLFCSADLDDDIVYELTKTFWEHLDEVMATNAALSAVTAEDAVTALAGLPIHDGAARYYKEIGLLE
jgi:TRAP transporter TAXI family solute receptor